MKLTTIPRIKRVSLDSPRLRRPRPSTRKINFPLRGGALSMAWSSPRSTLLHLPRLTRLLRPIQQAGVAMSAIAVFGMKRISTTPPVRTRRRQPQAFASK